jgi:hypothetical protein
VTAALTANSPRPRPDPVLCSLPYSPARKLQKLEIWIAKLKFSGKNGGWKNKDKNYCGKVLISQNVPVYLKTTEKKLQI